MEIIPFGEVLQERFQLSKDYKLVEQIGGIWRLTEKCKKNYDPVSYFYYLQGKREKPTGVVTPKPKNEPFLAPSSPPKDTKQQLVDELLLL